MLVKSLFKTKVETLQGKKEVEVGEVFECSKCIYNGLKTVYKGRFEFLPFTVIAKKSITFNGKEYKKGVIEEVTEERYKNLKSFNFNEFDFIETVEQFNKIKKVEEKKSKPKK